MKMKKLKNDFAKLAVCAVLALLLTACSYHFGDGLDSGAGSIGEAETSASSAAEESSKPEESVQEPSAAQESSKPEESAPEQSGEESKPDGQSRQEESSKPVESSREEKSSGASQSVDGELIGTTSKGYDIVVKDGITYVGGILIANKTYSLPKDYAPGFTGGTYKAFQVMQEAAAKEGVKLEIISGFRSYEKQQSIYQGWVNTYGQEYADTISARPGHSEHQSGLAMDINSLKFSFADTKEGIWLAENCWKYGFIIRYSKDKEDVTGYKYEPWHVRYLGKEMAKEVYDSGLCLEEYLGIDSEYKD